MCAGYMRRRRPAHRSGRGPTPCARSAKSARYRPEERATTALLRSARRSVRPCRPTLASDDTVIEERHLLNGASKIYILRAVILALAAASLTAGAAAAPREELYAVSGNDSFT